MANYNPTDSVSVFPEMRAQLRTYHSIPSLQLRADANAYKQLQDAPRLKSILKGATEDVEQPGTIEDIKAAPIPRTNPVNLIFVLAQQAPKISETHFDVPRDFFDLVMKEQLSSRSRAAAFLWLMWWYLESDFSTDAALNNPYGPGRSTREGDTEEMPLKCPQFEFLTDEASMKENVDTEEEVTFGEAKRKEREDILNGVITPHFSGPKRFNVQKSKSGLPQFPRKPVSLTRFRALLISSPVYPQNPVFSIAGGSSKGEDMGSPMPDTDTPSAGKSLLKAKNPRLSHRNSEHPSDSERTESASPITRGGSNKHLIDDILNHETSSPAPKKGPGRGNWRRNRQTINDAGELLANPRSNPKGGHELNAMTTVFVNANGSESVGVAEKANKRSRPPTSHQIALENFRKKRVNHILDRGLRTSRAKSDRKRQREGAVARAWKRIRTLAPGYDSEEEAAATGASRIVAARISNVALAGYRQNAWEKPDFGAEAAALSVAFQRVQRRLERAEEGVQAGVERRARRKRQREEAELMDEENDGEDEIGYGSERSGMSVA